MTETTAARTNALARDAALAEAVAFAAEPTAIIGFHSRGKLAIIGSAEHLTRAHEIAKSALPDLTLISTDHIPTTSLSVDQGGNWLDVSEQSVELTGHLGEFEIAVSDPTEPNQSRNEKFDLVLDLQTPPAISAAVKPLGYAAPETTESALQTAIKTLVELVGDFEKPKYFQYNSEICAHSRSGIPGCNRCIDACPTGAITSAAEWIDVDPYRCLGGGSCATACPTGAIIYSYPRPADTINRLRKLLRSYRDAGGTQPVIAFHDAEIGARDVTQNSNALGANVITFEVEEVGSVGLELWLSALAFGAHQVGLIATEAVPTSVYDELQTQLSFSEVILESLGYAPTSIFFTPAEQLNVALAAPGMSDAITAAGFSGSNEKRQALFFAIDHLHQQSTLQPNDAVMPKDAPFGNILVDQAACTLCMGCVSVCPAGALGAGGDTPRLDFVESNCVQCGMCETACPENAIALAPRIVFDPQIRRNRRVLNEEPPFHCVRCGTAFATISVITKMQEKLAEHPMFKDPTALNRLKMCGDCRVRDMFSEQLNS